MFNRAHQAPMFRKAVTERRRFTKQDVTSNFVKSGRNDVAGVAIIHFAAKSAFYENPIGHIVGPCRTRIGLTGFASEIDGCAHMRAWNKRVPHRIRLGGRFGKQHLSVDVHATPFRTNRVMYKAAEAHFRDEILILRCRRCKRLLRRAGSQSQGETEEADQSNNHRQ